MMITYDSTSGKWVAYSGGVPLASSRMLSVVKRRFPDHEVDEASAER